jgi:predicted RNase H-like HicB family nuclease
MLSGVLTSKRAVEVNVAIMRTFVRLRQLLATHEELARRLDQLEWRQSEQGGRVQYVFEMIQQLIEAPAPQDGRWVAEALDLPGVMCDGQTSGVRNVERLAIEVIADRVAHGELPSSALGVAFTIADEHLASQ